MIPGSSFTVYSLLNIDTGRHYYGRTMQPNERRYTHLSELSLGTHYNSKMQADHTAYPNWDFIVLRTDLTQLEANRLSDQLAKNDPNCYNLLGVVPSNPGSSQPRLTNAQVATMREAYFSEELNQLELAKIYGICQGHVSLIVNGLVRNSKGEFRPPTTRGAAKHAFAAEHRQAIRDLRAASGKQTLRSFLEETALKLNLPVNTVRYWLHNDPPTEHDVRTSTNQHHRPPQANVDGNTYQTFQHWLDETGGSINQLEVISSTARLHTYVTKGKRPYWVDGVRYTRDGLTMYEAKRRHGPLLNVEGKIGHYVTNQVIKDKLAAIKAKSEAHRVKRVLRKAERAAKRARLDQKRALNQQASTL
jgi:hypothetical protein